MELIQKIFENEVEVEVFSLFESFSIVSVVHFHQPSSGLSDNLTPLPPKMQPKCTRWVQDGLKI